jgi:alginate O-acetyltransferase complex protein AlgJ
MRAVATIAAAVFLAAALCGGAAAAEPAAVKDFRADCAARAAAPEKAGATAVAGKDGWLFLAVELRHLGITKFWGDEAARVSRAARPEWADPLPAILDFKAQLAKAGIELVMVPVPPKAAVYPDMLSDRIAVEKGAAPPRIDATDQEFYEVLRGAGVEVVDLAPDFLAGRFAKEGPLFCKQDSHWSGAGCVLAAQRIAAAIKDRPYLESAPKLAMASQWRTVEISGDLVGGAGARAAPKEKVPIRFAGEKTGEDPELIQPSRTSPVLLLGDSSCLVFHAGGDMHAVGAGLADQLAFELGLAVDLCAVRGSGATAARLNLYRRSQSDANYLKGKGVVIWCFAAREFTEGDGWQKVPIAAQAAPTPAL